MNIALLSIIALLLAIVIGVTKRVNMGIIALALTFLLATLFFDVSAFGLKKARDLYVQGWPMKIFFMMMAAMLMFSFANANGTIKLLAEKITYASGKKSKLLPWAFVMTTFTLTALGADLSVAAFVLPVAMMAGEKMNLHPIMLSVMTIGGALAGGASPVCIVGIVGSGLALEYGVSTYLPIWFAQMTTVFIEVIFVYFFFKGHKSVNAELEGFEKPEPFSKKQIMTMVIIGLALASVIFLKMDLAMSAFMAAAVMLLFNVADEKEALQNVSWNVLLLVGGVGVLVFTIKTVGGIDLISNALSSIMTEHTAVPIMSALGASMSFFASATGVVMPTLFPTAVDLSANMSGTVQPIQFMQGILAGSMGATPYSPLSALGAMAMATLPPSVDKEKHFSKMMLVAVINIFYVALLASTGIFNLFL